MNNTINFERSLKKIWQDKGNKKDFRIALKVMHKQIKFCKRIEQELKARNMTYEECYKFHTGETLKEIKKDYLSSDTNIAWEQIIRNKKIESNKKYKRKRRKFKRFF